MKIKVGTKFKAIEGLSKGKEFTVVSVDSISVTYRSEETGVLYNEPRKHFEKYLQTMASMCYYIREFDAYALGIFKF